MTTLSATDARKHFGQVLEMSRAGPVFITKNGQPAAVILSAEEYARLTSRGAGLPPEWSRR